MKLKSELRSDKPLTDFQYVDFKVEREEWNKYRLADKTYLKMKIVLINMVAEQGFKQKIEKAKKEKGKIGIDFHFNSTMLSASKLHRN
jgi:hypothetical protein